MEIKNGKRFKRFSISYDLHKYVEKLPKDLNKIYQLFARIIAILENSSKDDLSDIFFFLSLANFLRIDIKA